MLFFTPIKIKLKIVSKTPKDSQLKNNYFSTVPIAPPEGPVNQGSTGMNEYLFSQSAYFYSLDNKKEKKNWASLFGTHSYLCCPGSVVPAIDL
jgi:hypothetical protein